MVCAATRESRAGLHGIPLLTELFFNMASNLMNSAEIMKQIYNLAVTAVGWIKGGLGHVNVAVIFAGISGTAVADAGGLGALQIRAMLRVTRLLQELGSLKGERPHHVWSRGCATAPAPAADPVTF
jgi:hypothetical protein